MPFNGEHIFLFAVAVFAAGDEVGACALAAADDGDDVVHGEFFGGDSLFAVVALTSASEIFPPLGTSDLTGFGSLSLDVFFVRREEEVFHIKVTHTCSLASSMKISCTLIITPNESFTNETVDLFWFWVLAHNILFVVGVHFFANLPVEVQ